MIDYKVVSPLDVPPSHRLFVPAGCCIASCHPLIASPFCPLVVPTIFALPSPCRSPSMTPSNAVERFCHYQMLPPPPPLNTISIVHCHSCHPLPLSNVNAHLLPSPMSNTDARRCHLPPLVSTSIFALLAYP